MMSHEELAQKSLDRTKVSMMMKETVFMCTVAFSLSYEWTDEVPTAAVDGVTMYLNPEWWNTLTPGQQLGLILHEVMHVIYLHMERSIGLEQEKHNRAADHYINLKLLEQGFELPPNGLYDKQYKNMGVMQIYELLPDQPKSKNGWGGDIIYLGSDKDEDKIKMTNITNTIVKAMDQSELSGEDPGSIPGNIRRKMQRILNPILPWETLLQNYVNGFAKEDYSWKKANRRSTNDDIRLPTLWSEKLEHLAVIIDLSASVTDKDLNIFLSEIHHIKEKLKPQNVSVIGFDTRITDEHEVGEYDDIKSLTFKGKGGTNIDPPLKWIHEHEPTVTIILTDGEFSHSSQQVDTPVLWCIYGKRKFTWEFGEVITFTKSGL